jgi:hypothetical protein
MEFKSKYYNETQIESFIFSFFIFKNKKIISPVTPQDIVLEDKTNVPTSSKYHYFPKDTDKDIPSTSKVKLDDSIEKSPSQIKLTDKTKHTILEETKIASTSKVKIDDVNKYHSDYSSDNSINHYFPKDKGKITELHDKSILRQIKTSTQDKFTDLFKDIRSKRLEYGSPKQESKDLLDNNPTSENIPEINIDQARNNSGFSSPLSVILDKVKSLLTPKTENKELSRQPSISNLFQDTEALFDDNDIENTVEQVDSFVIDPFNKIKVTNESGLTLKETITNIDFNGMEDQAKSIRFINNDDQTSI